MAWQGADYLSAEWVSDGWLPKQAYAASPGAWVAHEYLSRGWAGTSWLHYIVTGVGAAVEVGNVPGLALVALSGSARQTTIVNATTSATPLAVLAAVANAGTRATQANVPGLALEVLSGTANGSVYQIADVTFTIEVASTFGYTKAVVAQNVPGAALAAIDAIVTEGSDVNVAATLVAVPLAALSASAKANSSTRAVSTIATPLGVFDCEVATGLHVFASDVLAVPLSVIPASVVASSNLQTSVTATLTSLPLATFSVGVNSGLERVIRGRSFAPRTGNRKLVATRPNRKLRA